MQRHRRRAGFSIIELVIFLAAIVVLVAIAAPRLIRSLERDRAPAMLEVLDSLPATLPPGAAEPLAVRVLDTRGQPVRGRRVEVISSAAADSIAPTQPRTDTTGVARFMIHMGADPGERTVRMQIAGSTVQKQLATSVGAAPATDPDTAAAPPLPE